MRPRSFMLIAGEASGDRYAAELVDALRERVLRSESVPTSDVQPLRTELAPHFFGAGGPRMKAAGVELAVDMTRHSIIGFYEVLQSLPKFRRLFRQLFGLAVGRLPDAIIGVDYGGFNLRFGKAIKNYVRRHRREFVPWNPKIVQFVSPQVWASRPDRAWTLADNYDLVLSIFPFEKEWYASRVPKLRVEFVGHPMVGRSPEAEAQRPRSGNGKALLLLPGSREDEVRRHLPVVTRTFELMRREMPGLLGRMVLPTDSLVAAAMDFGLPADVGIQAGGLHDALAQAALAITKSGTITMECAMSCLPAVVFYKTSWPTYLVGKQIVSVPHVAMPNLLAGEEIYPEFIQHAATPESIARSALALLGDEARRQAVKTKLDKLVGSLGGPGATGRAADAIISLLK